MTETTAAGSPLGPPRTGKLELAPPELEALTAALFDAYPKRRWLRRMLRTKLGVRLEAVAGGRTLPDQILDMVEWAEAHNRLLELVEGAHRGNLGHEGLRTLACTLCRRAGKEPPATALPGTELPRTPGAVLQQMARSRRGRWLMLLGGLVLSFGLVGLLGAEVQRSRLLLIGPVERGLHYPLASYLGNGLAALGGLFWSLWVVPVLGMEEQRLAFFLLAGILGVTLGFTWRLWSRLRIAWLVAMLPVFGMGAALMAQGVGIYHVLLPEDLASWPCHYRDTLGERIGSDVCSWLGNAGEVNEGHRSALRGLWSWLVLGLGVCLWACLREDGAPSRWRRLGRFAAVGYAGLLVFLLLFVGRAQALVRCGLQYPRVTALDTACDPPLATALASGQCRVWDLSAGAVEELLLYRCAGEAPAGLGAREGLRFLERRGGGRCVVGTAPAEVIGSRG